MINVIYQLKDVIVTSKMKKLRFTGLKSYDASPHLLKDLTKGNSYKFILRNGFNYIQTDKGDEIMISNNCKRQYFI